jgi:hypothetical protein
MEVSSRKAESGLVMDCRKGTMETRFSISAVFKKRLLIESKLASILRLIALILHRFFMSIPAFGSSMPLIEILVFLEGGRICLPLEVRVRALGWESKGEGLGGSGQ